jgi:hypothetical protein
MECRLSTAWHLPGDAEPAWMPLNLAVITDHIELHRTLTPQEEADVGAALGLLRVFIREHMVYAAFLANFTEFFTFADRIAAEYAADTRAIHTAHRLDMMLLEANRLIMNALGSARAYIDITDGRLAGAVRARYRAWKSLMYDQSFAYRLFENLRNVAQHSQLPIQAYSASRERSPDGTYRSEQAILIDRNSLLACDLQAPVRTEIEQLTGNIRVVDTAREYFERLGLVELLLMRETIAPYERAAVLVDDLVRSLGDPHQAMICLVEQNGNDLRVVDAHPHAIFLVRGFAQAIRDTDFIVLDAAAHAHPRWP